MSIARRWLFYRAFLEKEFAGSAPSLGWRLRSLLRGHPSKGLAMLEDRAYREHDYFSFTLQGRRRATYNRLLTAALSNKLDQKLWLDRVMPSVAPPVTHYVAGRKLVSLAGDSHSEAMRDRVREALDGRPLDALFIDGDHSYDGVKRDWELYSPLVRPGGVIGLHDVQEDYATSRGTQTAAISGEVPRFWRELREGRKTEELIADPAQDGYGIGVVYP